MDFLNELDVLAITITDEGKKQLSNFTFNPKYYYFSDDDVLYNKKNGEIQNNIFTRVKSQLKFDNESRPPTEVGIYNLGSYAPAWNIKFSGTSRKLDDIKYFDESGTPGFSESQKSLTIALEKYFKGYPFSSQYTFLSKIPSKIQYEERIPQFFINLKNKFFFDNKNKEIYHAFKDKNATIEIEHENVDGDEFEYELYEYKIDEFNNIYTRKYSNPETIFDFFHDKEVDILEGMNHNIYGNPQVPDQKDKC